jgi:membrane-associated phospholipid phosphatase
VATLWGVARVLPVLLALLTLSCASAKLAGRDVVAVARAPVKEWKNVAAATAVTGAVMLIDDEIAAGARKNDAPLLDSITNVVEPFGGGHSDKVMAAFLLYGVAAKNGKARAVAFDAIVSTTLASKAITPAIKQLAGRERPNGGDDPAFPSGHATQAFALATVIASHYEQRWVQWLAYGVATGVGLSRVYHDAHWTSDVIAGAAIGAFVGRTVVNTNRKERLSVRPVPGGVAVGLTW